MVSSDPTTLTLKTFVNSYLRLTREEAKAILYILDSDVPACFVKFEWGWVWKRRPHQWEPEFAEVRKPSLQEAALIFSEEVDQLRDFALDDPYRTQASAST